MELLPEDFQPGMVCEQRVQIRKLEGGCIALDWNPVAGKAIAWMGERSLEFQNPNITVRQALKCLGYPVADVEVVYGSLNSENLLDSEIRDMPLSQAHMTYKTQTVEVQSLLEMLREYEAGNTDLHDSILTLADGVLLHEDGSCNWPRHTLLTEEGFPVREQLDAHGCHVELEIATKQGSLYI